MYLHIATGRYPVTLDDIRAENPGDGIPNDAQTPAVIDYGYARVTATPQPDPIAHVHVAEGVPEQINGEYRQTWTSTPWTPEEISAEAQTEAVRLVRYYDGIVQKHLDDVARGFGYGDPNRPEVSPILHAISYAEEPAVERFMNEGRALRAWRSLVWVAAAGILNAVKAGDRGVPTEAELLEELPDPPTQDPL